MRFEIVREHFLEGLVVIAVVDVVGITQWEIALRAGIPWIVYPDLLQLLRCFDTCGRTEQQSIHKREYRRVQANAQGQCDDDGCSRTWILAE